MLAQLCTLVREVIANKIVYVIQLIQGVARRPSSLLATSIIAETCLAAITA